ncbi:MAG: hypothetical protein LBS79_02800 [Tannerella sp.]|jgi:hypothetical protein|nr:hypothetical protein [Tannerella sp.]
MRNKLDSLLSSDKITHIAYDDNEIYVVDYSNKSGSAKGVEVHNIKPDDIDDLTLKNESHLNITASIFGKQCFMDEENKEIKHCECVLYPTHSNPDTWVLFIEIKDCKPKNVSNYFTSAKEQIIQTVKLFRKCNLLDINKKVHAVISFPRNKTNFYHLLIPISESQMFFHQYKIIMRATNTLSIKNEKIIV